MNRANSSCNSVMLKDNNFRDNVLDNNSVLHVHIFSYLKGVYVVRFENVLIMRKCTSYSAQLCTENKLRKTKLRFYKLGR